MEPGTGTSGSASVAWGIDLAAPVALVAQRGFSGLVCNEVAELARWVRSRNSSRLAVADGVATELVAAEHGGGARVSLGVAVPGWFGAAQRDELVARLSTGSASVVISCVDSTVCLAVGSNRAGVRIVGDPAAEVVVAIDAEVGWSAAVARLADDEVRQLASVAVGPGVEPDRVALLLRLLSSARESGAVDIDRVVVVGGVVEHELVADALAAVVAPSTVPEVRAVATRRAVAGGAMVVADPAADIAAGRSFGPSWGPIRSTPWRLVQTVPSPSDVADEHGSADVHVVGPMPADAGSAAADEAALALAAGRVVSASSSAGVAVASSAVAVALAGLLGPPTGAARDLPAAEPPDVPADEPAEVWADVPAQEPIVDSTLAVVGGGSAMERSQVIDRTAPSALADALWRCERLLSAEVGALVAIRSLPGLVGCSDGASVDDLRRAAGGLRRVAERRDDPLGDALLGAIEVGLGSVELDPSRRYAGGTLADVAAEAARVVEHLRVVVGVVAAAERRRLVRDVMLLGPEPSLASELVDGVLASSGVPLHVVAEGRAPAAATALAVWSEAAAGFALEPSASDGAVAIRVVVTG